MRKINTIFITGLLLILITGLIGSQALALSLQVKDKEARKQYTNAKQQYTREVNFYKSAKQDYTTARSNYRQFKNADNRQVLEDKARSFLEKSITVLIKKLESIKNWVANKPSLDEGERKSIISEIDEDINYLNGKLSKIQIASAEQIKEEAKEIRSYWSNYRLKIKNITGRISVARINYIIKKAESISLRIKDKLASLENTTIDITQLENWLKDFDKKVALAKEKYEAGQTQFQLINNLSSANSLFSSGNQFIREAHEYIKEAYDILKQIIKEMKRL